MSALSDPPRLLFDFPARRRAHPPRAAVRARGPFARSCWTPGMAVTTRAPSARPV